MKGEVIAQYRKMSEEDRRTFERWLKANIIAAFSVVIVLLAATFVSSDSFGPNAAIAGNDSAAVTNPAPVPGRPMSAFDLMIRLAPDALPVEQVDQPF
jgi:hypothetical protein